MDELELRVFKKKRSVFVENVEMNNTLMDSFKNHEIFTNEECNSIMVRNIEKTNRILQIGISFNYSIIFLFKFIEIRMKEPKIQKL